MYLIHRIKTLKIESKAVNNIADNAVKNLASNIINKSMLLNRFDVLIMKNCGISLTKDMVLVLH